MKHNDNAATLAFKSQVDRMQDYFKAAGVEVPRTHLMEAAARFSGARDWRTLRAELGAKELPKKRPVPNLNGKSVRVYFEVHARSNYGDGPQFCWTDIDQRWVNRAFELRALCEEKNLSEIEDDFDMPDWMDDGEFRINTQGVSVTWNEFWFYGYPKHADYVCETSPVDIDKLMEQVLNTESAELYCFETPGVLDDLMGILERDEDHPDYVTENDPRCI